MTLCIKKLNDIRIVMNHEMDQIMDQVKRALNIGNEPDLQRIYQVLAEMKKSNVCVQNEITQ